MKKKLIIFWNKNTTWTKTTRSFRLLVGWFVWFEFICILCRCNNMESIADILLLEEFSCVVAASTLWVLDWSFNLDSLVCRIFFNRDLVCEVVLKVVNLHVGLKVFNEFLELEEVIFCCVGAVNVENVWCGHSWEEVLV